VSLSPHPAIAIKIAATTNAQPRREAGRIGVRIRGNATGLYVNTAALSAYRFFGADRTALRVRFLAGALLPDIDVALRFCEAFVAFLRGR